MIPTYHLLGVRINPLSIPDLHAVIAEIINSNQPNVSHQVTLHPEK